MERAGRPDDPRSAVLRADAAFGAARTEEAAELAAVAIDRAERAGAWGALCEALGVAARTTWCIDLAATTGAYRRAAQVAAEHGLTPWRVTALAGAGMTEALDHDDWPTLRQARELALDAGMLAQVASIDIITADVTMEVGGPRAAEPLALAAAETAARLRLPGLEGPARVAVAVYRAVAGDDAGAARQLDAVRSGSFPLRRRPGPRGGGRPVRRARRARPAPRGRRAGGGRVDGAAPGSGTPALPRRGVGPAAHGGRRPRRRGPGPAGTPSSGPRAGQPRRPGLRDRDRGRSPRPGDGCDRPSRRRRRGARGAPVVAPGAAHGGARGGDRGRVG